MGLALFRQAAEEDGGAYTSRREITGKDGSPLVTIYRPEVLLPENGRDGPEGGPVATLQRGQVDFREPQAGFKSTLKAGTGTGSVDDGP